MIRRRKLLKFPKTDQNGIQEADGSIPFSSTVFTGCSRRPPRWVGIIWASSVIRTKCPLLTVLHIQLTDLQGRYRPEGTEDEYLYGFALLGIAPTGREPGDLFQFVRLDFR